MNRLLGIILLVFIPISAWAAPVPKANSIPTETIKAWEAAGAGFTFGKGSFQPGMEFETIDELRARGLLGVQFSNWDCRSGKIPPIRTPHYLQFLNRVPDDHWTERFEDTQTTLGLVLSHLKGTDRVLRQMDSFPNLEILVICDCDETPNGLEHLRSLKKLKVLRIHSHHPGPHFGRHIPSNPCGDLDRLFETLTHLPLLTDLQINDRKFSAESLRFLKSLKHLTKLDLSRNNVGAEHCQYLGELKQLTDLNLKCSNVDDNSMVHLGKLTRLESLDLSYCNITDRGVANLEHLVQLRVLDLTSNDIQGVGLNALHRMKNLKDLTLMRVRFTGENTVLDFPSLEVLRLDNSKVTSAGVHCLNKLNRLKELRMTCHVTGENAEVFRNLQSLEKLDMSSSQLDTLEFLRHIPHLNRLDLVYAQIFDCHYEAFKSLAALETLNLAGTGINDDDLCHLSQMKQLKTLYLVFTCVNGTGLKHLKKLNQLEKLYIGSPLLSSDDLLHLKGLPKLNDLSIRESCLNAAILPHFEGFASLNKLAISSASLKSEEVASQICLPASLKHLWIENNSNDEDQAQATILSNRYPNCSISLGSCHRNSR